MLFLIKGDMNCMKVYDRGKEFNNVPVESEYLNICLEQIILIDCLY